MLTWLGVAVLGGLGAVARYAVDAGVTERAGRAFPWGTLAVNLSGSFVLGLLVGLEIGGDSLLLAGTAAVGSYTTFSTWMLESDRLRVEGRAARMWLNLAGSLLAGLLVALLGKAVGGLL